MACMRREEVSFIVLAEQIVAVNIEKNRKIEIRFTYMVRSLNYFICMVLRITP